MTKAYSKMVTTGRIDISGQTGMCDTSRVEISRSMPAVMEGRMNDFAWKSFCDKMDEALEPVTKAKKIMVCALVHVVSVVCKNIFSLCCIFLSIVVIICLCCWS